MKYRIDTTPVLDAFAADGGCRICGMQNKVEAEYAEGFLGDSVMEPAVRVEVNKLGFCPDHWAMLYAHPNKLAVALMLQTHLKELNTTLAKNVKNKKSAKASITVDNALSSCILCARLNKTMRRLSYTAVHMYYNETGFKEVFRESGGFCLPHYKLLLHAASEYGDSRAAEFISMLHAMQHEHMAEVISNIDSFTKQFDYRSEGVPPEYVKNAVSTAIKHLCSEKGE